MDLISRFFTLWHGIQDASPVYTSLRQCCASRSLCLGKLVHSSIQRAGLGSDTFLANLLLHMYSECGRIDNAFSAFDAIARKNVFSGNLMIAAYAQAGHLEEARMVFEEMPVRSTVSWNSFIGVESLVLFWEMNLEGVRPNSVTFMAAIEACTAMEEISHGRLVHAVVLSCEEETSVGVMNALINMYGKHSRVADAGEIFASIRKSDLVEQHDRSLLSKWSSPGSQGYIRRHGSGSKYRDLEHDDSVPTHRANPPELARWSLLP